MLFKVDQPPSCCLTFLLEGFAEPGSLHVPINLVVLSICLEKRDGHSSSCRVPVAYMPLQVKRHYYSVLSNLTAVYRTGCHRQICKETSMRTIISQAKVQVLLQKVSNELAAIAAEGARNVEATG